ncbi:hypothetical protein H5410_049172 [Solanum commersonii]|uniref:Glycine-rich protein n=1 Tax=Solanum commersonii TaxID=4109 RepID=A0A9J5XLS7_SOLCO|nr:hypothetical protein H5410_049172 [Solanum commersonii]
MKRLRGGCCRGSWTRFSGCSAICSLDFDFLREEEEETYSGLGRVSVESSGLLELEIEEEILDEGVVVDDDDGYGWGGGRGGFGFGWGGRGGWGGGGGRWGGGCQYGCCGHRYGNCYQCCYSAAEAKAYHQNEIQP